MKLKNKDLTNKTIAYCSLILGWVFSGSLMYHATNLKNSASASDLFAAILGNSCDKALTNPISWILNYPLAAWGLAYFGLIGLLLSLNKYFIDRFLVALSAFGVGATVFLTYIILNGHLSCPLCLLIHGVNLLLFLALIGNAQKTAPEILFKNASVLRGGIIVITAMVLGGFSPYYSIKYSFNKNTAVNLEEINKKFQSANVFNIPKNTASPNIGSLTAPIQLTVFSSFQCPACQSFAPILENLHKKFGDNIGISFKNFPLSKTCNPQMLEDMQPQACGAAFAAKAAQMQNQFWQYHDEIFNSNLEVDDKSLSKMAKTIGLNMEKFEVDKKSEAIKASIADDVNLAYQLGINATPSVLINGRLVSSHDESVLNFLIQNELEKLRK